jgi:hypothetical protein
MECGAPSLSLLAWINLIITGSTGHDLSHPESGLTALGTKQAKIFLVRAWQYEVRKMPTLLPNGWLIFSIFVFVDGSHVFPMVPNCATDAGGPEPEQGPRIGLGLPDGHGTGLH